jgi:hypothetical protein
MNANLKECGKSGRAGGPAIVALAVALVLGAVVYAAMTSGKPEPRPVAAPAPLSQQPPSEEAIPFRVYYFHRTVRCPSCETIEALTQAVVEEDFVVELTTSNMMWKTFNLDNKENRHFEDDYKLQAQSVVLSEVRDGKEVRWKNLQKVWDLLGDEAAFRRYIKQEVQAFLTGQQENES